MTTTITGTRGTPVGARVQSVRWGLAALVLACALAVLGAYGDPHPKASQEQAVPFICAVLVVLAAGIFGFLVPAGLRSAARPGWSGAALALGILAVLCVPVAFWSGLPLLLGTAGVLVGTAGRQAATAAGRGRGVPGWAVGLSAFAIVACLVMGIVGTWVVPD
jgi:hypothetical protein